ncbi:unnamed protein product [Auanema sp. JU1783]|nr:unnamed protein product [Auanema sp. JU1783]
MNCVGGSARGEFAPKVVQCFQTGHDGLDYQWRCTADLPRDLEFGEVTVTCEGYDYPEDRFILAGSCGLEYKLEHRADNYAEKDYNNRKTKHATSLMEDVVPYIVLAFIVFIFYITCARGVRENFPGNGGGSNPGPGYPPNDHPGPPPGYDDVFGKKTNTHTRSPNANADANAGPGFWTGTGLGALGGYLYGRSQGNQQRSRQTSRSQDSHYASDSFGSSTATTEMESSSGSLFVDEAHEFCAFSGYGGTRRR